MSKTGFDKYFEQQMTDPVVAAEYTKARAEIDATDEMVRSVLRAIDAAREAANMTKAELAKRAGFKPDYVRGLFSREGANPTIATLATLVRAVGHRMTLERDPQRAHKTARANSTGSEKPARATRGKSEGKTNKRRATSRVLAAAY